MKKRFIATALIFSVIITLSLSVKFGSSDLIFDHPDNYSQIGFPAIVTIKYEPTEHPVEYETHVDLERENLMSVFIILGIPVFLSGYLWGKSNNKIPSQP